MEIVLYGELDKWVPMSPQRVLQVATITDNVYVDIKGAAGEPIEFHATVNNKWRKYKCIMGTDGTTRINIRGSCE